MLECSLIIYCVELVCGMRVSRGIGNFGVEV